MVQNWRKIYRGKITSAHDALVQVLENGCRIYIGTACSTPQHLVQELASCLGRLIDIEVLYSIALGSSPFIQEDLSRVCRVKTFFVTETLREAVFDGRADYIPVYLSQVPNLFNSGVLSLDLALIQVAPPDEHGFCSLGVSVDVVKAAVENARYVLAQVNPQMPRVLGDSFIHVSEVDAFVEREEPLIEAPLRERQPVAERMAKHVAKLVEDGATIQVGIGRILSAVLSHLTEKRDLGVHSEMITDAYLPLVEKGVITGKKKTIHQDKMVTSFCLGTRRLFDFVHDNPQVEFHPSEYVNHPNVISQNHRMTAINSALQVDLSGQVCADSLGYKVFSGIGGYVDFSVGASRSTGGKSIIVLPSTSSDGQKSRIVSHLTLGAGVVGTRASAQYVVTEFGIAHLHGKTIRERALSLINVSHPRFRQELLEEAKRIRYVYDDQMLSPSFGQFYPEDCETYQTFDSGLKVFFRPIKATDERALQEFFYSLPGEDIYYRFLSSMKVFPHRDTQAMVNIDYETEMTIVGVVGDIGSERIVAVGRYILDQKSNFAEVDFAVRSEVQHKGIGTFLVHYLSKIAQSNGVSGFMAYVLAANRRMLGVFRKTGYVIHSRLEDGIYEINFRFDERAEEGGGEEQ
ncbi:MAG: GNAT family N-acetyltransferase [Deltaproteobacteria bacterium]|nr:MAG: GNAT family N-acetyltransferase [Deltaproteobacteria bacterium]